MIVQPETRDRISAYFRTYECEKLHLSRLLLVEKTKKTVLSAFYAIYLLIMRTD